MKVFAKKMAELFAHDLSSSEESLIPLYVKIDAICRFTAHLMKASSVSIILYNGQEDRLNCRGSYINSHNVIEPSDPENPVLNMLKKICVYSFINSIKRTRRRLNPELLFSEYIKGGLKGGNLTEEDFTNAYDYYHEWKNAYQKYSKTLISETYTVDDNSLIGNYYRKLLAYRPEYRSDMYFADIDRLPEETLGFIPALKEKLNISFDAKYLIAMPLFANSDYFGVIRITLPHDSNHLEKSNNGEVSLSDYYKKQIEYTTQLISLHLENNFILDGYKKIYFSSQKHLKEFENLEVFFSDQCDKFSEIIESKGAIIRLWDKQTGRTTIAGYSKTLEQYLKAVSSEKLDYFEGIVKKLQDKKNILGVHFNTNAPFDVCNYIIHNDKDYLSYRSEEWQADELLEHDVLKIMQEWSLFYVAILPIPWVEKSYIIFLNSHNRNFLSKDFEMIYPAIKNLGLEIDAYYYTKKIQDRLNIINTMHDEISSATFEDYNGRVELENKFFGIVGNAIQKLEVSSYQIFWKYNADENEPNNPHSERGKDSFVNRYMVNGEDFNTAIPSFKWVKDSIMQVDEDEIAMTWSHSFYFGGGTLKRIFDLEFEDGYLYFDLPFYNYNVPKGEPPKLVGIITLVYKKDVQQLIKNKDFFSFMQFFSRQISMAWANLPID